MRSDRSRAELGLLYDLYGGLLTPNQRRVFEYRHHRDLSLGEIAEAEGISRQAVHDVLERGRRALEEAEAGLKLAARWRRQQRLMSEALDHAERLAAAVDRPGAADDGAGGVMRAEARVLVELLRRLRREL